MLKETWWNLLSKRLPIILKKWISMCRFSISKEMLANELKNCNAMEPSMLKDKSPAIALLMGTWGVFVSTKPKKKLGPLIKSY